MNGTLSGILAAEVKPYSRSAFQSTEHIENSAKEKTRSNL